MSSPWAEKLEKRLTALADGASKDSLQTLAKWIGFNRKHAAAFCEAFKKAMEVQTRQLLYYHVIDEVMLLEKGNAKWDKLQDIRTTLGETVVASEFEKLDDVNVIDQLKVLVDQWDNANAFGGPMLIHRLRQLLKTSSKSGDVGSPAPDVRLAEETTVAMSESTSDVLEISAIQAEEKQIENILEIAVKPKLVTREESSRSLGEQEEVSFDFEAEGIPQGKVDAKEFLEPCKALATFQIARDLRADTAAHLSSILSAVSDEIKQSYQGLSSDDLSPELVQNLSIRLTDNVLDMDIDEALQNVETFRELVQKQHTAKQRLINLLLKSRCQFGSNEAAEAFYGLEDIKAKLQRRKDLLSDAMELEGLDIEEGDKAEGEDIIKSLAPLTWYKSNDVEPEAKRAKIE